MISLWKGVDVEVAEAQMRGLNRRLAELDQALISAQAIVAESPSSFAARMSLRSLSKMQIALESERSLLASHRVCEHVSVALKGQEFADNTASIGQLGYFLIRLQKLYSSIAQAITSGPTQRGPISRDISRMTNLRFADTYASSFGMDLFVDQKFDIFGESVATAALQTMFNLLNSTSKEKEISRLSAELGPRAVTHLRHVLDDLFRSGSGLSVAWKDLAGTKYKWCVSSEAVHSLKQNTSRFKTSNSVVKIIEGVLVGVSLLKDRFELVTRDGNVIEGKLARNAKLTIRNYFAHACEATIEVTTVEEVVTNEKKTFFTLTAINDVHSNALK